MPVLWEGECVMITEEEAIKIACRHVKLEPKDILGPVTLVTLTSLANNPMTKELRQKRPDAWNLIVKKHYDYWRIRFPTGLPQGAHPDRFFVKVNAETGEVEVPMVL